MEPPIASFQDKERDAFVPSRNQMPLQQADLDTTILPTSNVPALPGTAASSITSHRTNTPHRPQITSTHSGTKQLYSNGKVPIPRQRATAAPRHSRRVPRACQSCRQRKTKCSGDTPVCRQCKELSIQCDYPVSWREKMNRQLKDLSNKTRDYEELLKDIEHIVDGSTSERIKEALGKHVAEVDRSPAERQSQPISQEDMMDEHPDDMSSPSSIGSLEAIERVEEDLNRNETTRATGYMGKNSEVTWMQRLRREAEQRAKKEPGTYDPDPDNESDYALHSGNYHLDDMEVSIPGPVQVYEVPPRPLADKLFEDYLASVHPFFPIISRPLFSTQYQSFYDNSGRPGDKWLAILNVIFAISAKRAHLKQAPWQGEEHDHLVYLTRARILSMNGDVLFSHPDLQQIQVEGLIAFYLIASDQVNRAWRIAALAIRSAITLGINMKNTSDFTASISKESRNRVWWCLYTLEHLLGIMTGRATCILDGVCTTPLPLPFEGDQLQEPLVAKLLNDLSLREEFVGNAIASSFIHQISSNPLGGKDAKYTDIPRDVTWLKSLPPNNALCFLYYADLAVISQEIVNRVYSPDCAMVPWAHIENRIGVLRSRLDLWFASLHPAFDFTRKEDEGPDLLRAKLFLAFHFYSSRITLGRPCLCRRDAHQSGQGNEKPAFSHVMAMLSLDSANKMLDLIPDQADAIQLYEIGPWWCVLHCLVQSVTILLLELSFGSIHIPEEEQNIFTMAKKGVRWLHSMSEFSTASRRAWQLCDMNLRKIAQGMDYDVSHMPTFDFGADEVTNGHKDQLNGSFKTNGIDKAAHQDNGQLPDGPGLPPGAAGFTLISDADGAPDAGPAPGIGLNGNDVFFPYDPINGEFVRSYFPTFYTDENQEWGF